MFHFKKYFAIMRTTFVDIKAYKGEFIGVLIWTPVHFILLFFIWTIIYQLKETFLRKIEVENYEFLSLGFLDICTSLWPCSRS